MICFLNTPNHAEAHLTQQFLEQAGIYAQLRGSTIPQGFVAEMNAQVWIRAEDLAEAKKVMGIETPVSDGRLSLVKLADEQGALSEPGSPSMAKTCPECGEDWEPGFEVCWNCQHALEG